MFDVRHIRKERRRRDTDVAHPDDADLPDRAVFLDMCCEVLGQYIPPVCTQGSYSAMIAATSRRHVRHRTGRSVAGFSAPIRSVSAADEDLPAVLHPSGVLPEGHARHLKDVGLGQHRPRAGSGRCRRTWCIQRYWERERA